MSYTEPNGFDAETEGSPHLPKLKLEHDSTKEVTEYKLE
jgi:hypothetical protein